MLSYNENQFFQKNILTAKEILNTYNIPYSKEATVQAINNKSTWGFCKTNYVRGKKVYKIYIQEDMIKANKPDPLIQTIIHEFLHTVPGGNSHTGNWKYWAKIISSNTKYNITRLVTAQELGLDESDVKYKYKAVCEGCGETTYFFRDCEFIKTKGKDYHCTVCKSKGKFNIYKSREAFYFMKNKNVYKNLYYIIAKLIV